MEYTMQKDHFAMLEPVLDTIVEQTVEEEYLLPDYCPNVFQILLCKPTVKIVSSRVVGNKLSLDGMLQITILYTSDETEKIKQIEQRHSFQKTVDLKTISGDSLWIKTHPSCDHVHCRAINSRRLEVRCNIGIALQVWQKKTKEVLGANDALQLHYQELPLCKEVISVEKDFHWKEQLELPSSRPPIQDVLLYEAYLVPSECKWMANKVLCKGELKLYLLYLCSDHPTRPEKEEFTVPISQMIDAQDMEESDEIQVSFDVQRFDMDLQVDEDGECRHFVAELSAKGQCQAMRTSTVRAVDDCYSTQFETKVDTERVSYRHFLKTDPALQTVKTSLALSSENVSQVYWVSCQRITYHCEEKDNKLLLLAHLLLQILVQQDDGSFAALEQTVPIELDMYRREGVPCETDCRVKLRVLSIEPVLRPNGELELEIFYLYDGLLYENRSFQAVTDAVIDETNPKDKNDKVSLRLYFAEPGESVWQIAKQYHTSMQAILSQNDLSKESIDQRSMIFIPILE